jgi:hypothetical protein
MSGTATEENLQELKDLFAMYDINGTGAEQPCPFRRVEPARHLSVPLYLKLKLHAANTFSVSKRAKFSIKRHFSGRLF